jgi:hypothetical protein
VGTIALGAWSLTRRSSPIRGACALGVGAVLIITVLSSGLRFLPGLLVASPLAAAGFALLWGNRRLLAIGSIALGSVVVVWVAQYSGNAAPQWGARYQLLSGLLLAVVAVAELGRRPRALVAVALVAGIVTIAGVAWLSERQEAIADGLETVIARQDEAVISLEAHLFREGGSFYSPERHWLTATNDVELRRAFAVVHEAGDHEVAVIAPPGTRLPRSIQGFERGASEPYALVPRTPLEVVEYHAE